MSKNTFIGFGILILVLAVAIPVWAFRADGDSNTGAREVSASLKSGKSLFDTNCGACHALYAAGTDGNFGPDLDELLAPAGPIEGDAVEAAQGRVLNAIENGVDATTEPGRMPAGIIDGEQAEEVAEFVAQTAGRG